MAAALTLASCVMLGGLLASREADRLSSTVLDAHSSPSPPAKPLALSTRPAPNQDDRSGPGENNSDRIEINGGVLDPKGRPLTGASLYVGYTPGVWKPRRYAIGPSIAAWQPAAAMDDFTLPLPARSWTKDTWMPRGRS